MTVVDDTYDAYDTLPEVISFADALQKYNLFLLIFLLDSILMSSL